MLDSEDFYLGWVVQPLDMEESLFYVYGRKDTPSPCGFLVEGSKRDAFRLIEDRIIRK